MPSKGYLAIVNNRLFSKVKKLCNGFYFKYPVTQCFTSGVVYKFQCGLRNKSYYEESVRHLAVWRVNHIGIYFLAIKNVQPRKGSAFRHHLLNCNYSLTFEKSLVLMGDGLSVNRNIHFTLSCLNEFLSHCLMHFVDFCDEISSYFI